MLDNIRERLARLTPEQRARLLAHTDARRADPSEIRPRAADATVPLSSVQERMWVLMQIDGDAGGQNIAGLLHFHGDFDPGRFRDAMTAVQMRHEILRTAIRVHDGQAVQEVLDAPVVDFSFRDLGSDTGSEDGGDARVDGKDASLNKLLLDEARRPFDLASGCLLRSVVVRTAANRFQAMVSMHHMVSDGGSIGVMIDEILAAYRGELDQRDALPVQYGDYAVWQRNRLAAQRPSERLGFWESELAGMPQHLALPFFRTRSIPEAGGRRSARLMIGLPGAMIERLQAFARVEGVTLFHVLLAGYALALMRHAAQYDGAIGIPVSARTRPELQPLVGCFINLLPVRVDAEHRPSFRQFVVAIRDRVLAALEQAETPFEEIVSRFAPDRGTGLTPLFQHTFSFERAPDDVSFTLSGIEGNFEEFALGNSPYELSLELNQHASGISGWFDYSLSMFDADDVRDFGDCMMRLLDAGVQTPDTPVDQLPVLSPAGMRARLIGANDGDEAPPPLGVHRLFSGVAASMPDATALTGDGIHVTYRELDARSDRLAQGLVAAGSHRGDVIAIGMERSVEAIVSMLAVLKCGCVFFPLDIRQPAGRLRDMLSRAQVEMVLVESAQQSSVSGIEDIRLLCVDDPGVVPASGEQGDDAFRAAEVEPDDPAYVMFTSGSTGVPKGVLVPHRGIVRLVRHTGYASFGPGWTGLLLAPLAFDASTFEIWGPLLNGGTLAIPPRGLLGYDQVGDQIRRHGVNSLWLTAGLFQGMVEEAIDDLAPLGQLLTGGDVLPVHQVGKFLRAYPDCRLINGYGPTEGTTFTCCHDISPDDLDWGGIPIGRRISGTRIYVLDEHMQPVPQGGVGELWIGGDGVALGYLNDPERTAQSFRDDPWSDRPGARMYRTGDMVRQRPDGVVLFMGRRDHQMKLRGFRIEPGEIESVMATLPGVSEAVVALRKDGPGDSARLCGYVVASDGEELPAVTVLRQRLREVLPDYMVPAVIMRIDQIPLSGNGKVDRRRLPDPGVDMPESVVQEPPQSAVEVRLARLWQGLFGKPVADRHANFFELGGDSIQIIQLVARAPSAYLSFNAADVFAHPVLSDLARVVTDLEVAESPVHETPTGVVPLTPIQSWFLSTMPQAPSRWNQWLVIPLEPVLPLQDMADVLASCCERHDAFRLRLKRDGERWQQVLDERPGVVIDILDGTELSGGRRDDAVVALLNRMHGALDLEEGPVLRAALFMDPVSRSPRLAMVAHHLVIDMVSWFNLIEQFRAACRASAGGLPLPVPAAIPFSTWARQLEDHAGMLDAAGARRFWEGHPWEEAARIRATSPQAGNTERDARTRVFSVEIPGSAGMHALGADAWKTMLSTLDLRAHELVAMALAWAIARSEGRGVSAARLELEGSGRGHEAGLDDNSQTVGWFTLLYPVLLDVDLSRLDECIGQCRDMLRAFEAQARALGCLSFGQGARLPDAPRVPAGELVMNYLGEVDETLEFGLSSHAQVMARDADAPRAHDIVMDVQKARHALLLSCTWAGLRYREEDIEHLVRCFGECVNLLAEYARERAMQSPDAGVPADGILTGSEYAMLMAGEFGPVEEIEDVLPLTALQQGLLFHALSHPGRDHYLVQFYCTISGTPDPVCLWEACLLTVKRHPALRALFHHDGLSQPVQLIHRDFPLVWHHEDAGQPMNEAAWEQWIAADRGEEFDLAHGPLMRFALLPLENGEYRFVWTYHHILMDGWSVAIVARDLFSTYAALAAGHQPASEDVPAFREFVLQRASAPSPDALDAWEAYLSGLEAPTVFPRSLPPSRSACPAPPVIDAELDEAATRALQQASAQAKATLATLVQGVFGLVLGSLCGRDDVVFGNTVSGRNISMPDVDRIVGLCINTVPVRVRIDREAYLKDYLSALQQNNARMMAHEGCGLVDIQGRSPLNRHQSLFEAVIVVENYPVDTASVSRDEDALRVHGFGTRESIGFPVTLMIIPGERMRLRLFHDADAFAGLDPAGMLDGLLDSVMRALKALPLALGQPIGTFFGQLGLVMPEQKQAMRPVLPAGSGVPHQERGNEQGGDDRAGASSELESRVGAIWAELLGLETCPHDADFFDLGGHSLMILQMRNRIREQLGMDVPVVDLLQHATVRRLSRFLEGDSGSDSLMKSSMGRGQQRSERRRRRGNTRK